MNRFAGRRPEQLTRLPVRHRRRNRLQLGRLLLGMTLFASTLVTPVGVAAQVVDGCCCEEDRESSGWASGQRNVSSPDLQCVNGQVNTTFRGLKEPVAVESA